MPYTMVYFIPFVKIDAVCAHSEIPTVSRSKILTVPSEEELQALLSCPPRMQRMVLVRAPFMGCTVRSCTFSKSQTAT